MVLTPAQIEFDPEGRLISTAYDDIYFQPEDSRAEAEYVFLQKGRLYENLAGLTDEIIIGELGFGTGLNFLLTWQAFHEKAPKDTRLHFISFEKHPIRKADLQKIHAYWPDLTMLSDQLLEQYPVLDAGVHRCVFQDNRVSLTLVFGDILDTLPEMSFGPGLDLWYLDGFAPAKNPVMWADSLWPELAAATRTGGRVTTFTAAGAVKRGLQQAGFTIEKTRGYGRKRDMLIGELTTRPAPLPARQPAYYRPPAKSDRPSSVAVIGAGIAGCSLAEALTRHGLTVSLIERHEAPAREASGNPMAAVYPKLNARPDFADRFYRQAFAYGYNFYQQLPDSGFSACGVLHIDRNIETKARHQKIAARGLPDDLVCYLDPKEASDIAGIMMATGGLFYPKGGTVLPKQLCRSLLTKARATGRLQEYYQTDVTALQQESGRWHLSTHKAPLYADIVILADGTGLTTADQTAWLPLEYVQGQVTGWSGTIVTRSLKTVLCHKGYITPVFEGEHCLGATFDKGAAMDDLAEIGGNQRNMAQFCAELPEFAAEYQLSALTGRKATRMASADRLPVLGPVIDKDSFDQTYAALADDATTVFQTPPRYHNGLFIMGGLGSHGMTTAPYLAEILAGQLADRPLAGFDNLITGLLPSRFAVRDLKRKKSG